MPLSLLPLLGYLSGSFPFSIWITRLVKGVDVRDAGSHHATTTNTIRQAGFGWGALVMILDIGKGFLPTWLAVTAGAPDWLVGMTAAAAVAGHCWPILAGFRGGMGLATAGGAFLATSPLGFAVLLGILIALTLILKHGARASVITGLLFAPALWLVGLRGAVIWVGIFCGLVIAARFTIDWRREYRELWLDRKPDV